ncbi:MAG: hypothetical protein OXG78_05040 [Chloroflexi bacterium]|nr:hypothetical protein [Chloroflexota bacterium]
MLRWTIGFLVLVSGFLVAGQTRPRDYAVSTSAVSYDADAATAIIAFTVENKGGDAQEETEILATLYQSADTEIRETLPALLAGQKRDIEIHFPMAGLPPKEISTVELRVGIDQFELDGSPIARNNRQLVYINPEDAGLAAGADSGIGATSPIYDLYLPLVNLGINFVEAGLEVNGRVYGGGELLGFAGVILVTLICLWLLSLVLRLILRRPPKFEPWQAPYAIGAWTDPNSALGRRQGWQMHAQNPMIEAPRAPNQVAVIKRLTDDGGINLGSWNIQAVRTAQYDIYGRISRSEVVMPRAINKRLTRIAQRGPGLDQAGLRKAIRPVAQRLCRHALAAIEKQNRSLPLALDMRFEGDPDVARVHFELYQYRSDAWHLIDEWEPEMSKPGARIPEHFTFSLNGQLPGENYREFKARLRDDVTELLAGLVGERHIEVAPGSNDYGRASPHSEAADGDAGWPSAGPDDETDAR